MSFESRETSRSLGTPISLLLFRWAAHSDAFSGYTDADRAVSHQPSGFDAPILFEPTTIEIPQRRIAGTPDRNRIEFALPRDIGIAELYRTQPPSYVTTVRMFQGHEDDPEQQFIATWAGRVLGVRFDGPQAKFICDPVSSASRRVGLRRPYQLGCPHVLYGPQCKADKVAATTTLFLGLSDISNTSIRIADGVLPNDSQKYFGGIVRWCADRGEVIRTISGVEELSSDVILHLGGPTTGLDEEMAVDITLGCAHTMDDCLNLHNNIHNHGGFPFIPTENPIGTQNNIFY